MKEKEEQTKQVHPAPVDDTGHAGWRKALAKRNAELDLDDDEAVGNYLSQSFADYDKAITERKKFNDVLSSDPHAAELLTGLASGKDESGETFSLVAFLLDKYADEISEFTNSEEGIARVRKKEAEAVKKAAEAEARKKESDENLKKSDEELTKAVQQTNIDEAKVNEMLSWLYGEEGKEGFILRIIKNKLDSKDWEVLIHAFNRDSDLESARVEGARNIRKARSVAHRNLDEAPTDLGGGSGGEQHEEEDPTVSLYRNMKRKF